MCRHLPPLGTTGQGGLYVAGGGYFAQGGDGSSGAVDRISGEEIWSLGWGQRIYPSLGI